MIAASATPTNAGHIPLDYTPVIDIRVLSPALLFLVSERTKRRARKPKTKDLRTSHNTLFRRVCGAPNDGAIDSETDESDPRLSQIRSKSPGWSTATAL